MNIRITSIVVQLNSFNLVTDLSFGNSINENIPCGIFSPSEMSTIRSSSH